jgi:hypothetical protein
MQDKKRGTPTCFPKLIPSTNIVQHRGVGENSTFPIPTATKKQPKPKNQTAPQPERGMGTLRRNPPPQKEKQ